MTQDSQQSGRKTGGAVQQAKELNEEYAHF